MLFKTKKRKYLAAAATLVIAVLLTLATFLAGSFWEDESRAVHIDAQSIEPSTLIIGTHLIHLSALTDSIYDIAIESAEESGQNKIYYKSELGGNAWFDITTASSLADITTSGTPVTDEEIGALFLTHHTKSDKITYDLKTGEAVNIFNIRNPYDIEALDEMLPLKMQYDRILSLTGEDDFTKRIDRIWATKVEEPPITSDVEGLKKSSEYNADLEALERYLSVLRENDGGALEIDKVSGVMKAADASRRYLVYATLYPILDSYLEEISTGKSVMPALVEGEEPVVVESEIASAELISAAAESLGNVQGAMISQAGNMLSAGETVISAAEFGFMNDLIAHARENSHSDCDNDVKNLIDIDNIQNDNITNITRELATIEGSLIPEATTKYLGMLELGEGAEYKAQKANKAAEVLLNRFFDEYKNNTNSARGELEFLIEAKTKRMDAESGMKFIAELLETVSSGYAAKVPESDFREGALESIQAHIEFLTELHRELELSTGGNDLDKLIVEKQDLQTERMKALDNDNLVKAEELRKQIEDVEEKIRAMENESAAKISELQEKIDSLEDGSAEQMAAIAELDRFKNSLSDGSLGATVNKMREEGDAEGLATLLPMAPDLVLPALQDIYNDLLLNGGDSDLIEMIEEAILENPTALKSELGKADIKKILDEWLDGLGKGDGSGAGTSTGTGAGLGAGTGTGTGSGSGNGTGADSGSGLGASSGSGAGSGAGSGSGSGLFSGVGGISDTDAKNAVAAILGISKFAAETGNDKAAKVAASLAQEQKNLGNAAVFVAANDSIGEYVPLSGIQAITGRRYVWNKNRSLGYLAHGSDYYGFTVYSNLVYRDRDGKKTETMPQAAKFRNVVYIPKAYATEAFGVDAEFIEGSELGCVYDDEILRLGEELFIKLLES